MARRDVAKASTQSPGLVRTRFARCHPSQRLLTQCFRIRALGVSAHPDAGVLSRETGYDRNYGQNPYAGYDDTDSSPFLYDGPRTPDDLPRWRA